MKITLNITSDEVNQAIRQWITLKNGVRVPPEGDLTIKEGYNGDFTAVYEVETE